MNLRHIYLIFTLLPTHSSCLVIFDSSLATSCVYYMATLEWGCGSHTNSMKSYKCRCHNVDWLGSVAECIHMYGNNTREITHAYKHVATRCLDKAHLHYSVTDFEKWQRNATSYIRDVTKSDITTLVTTPVAAPIGNFSYYYQSFRDFNTYIHLCERLGWGLVGIWVGITLISGLIQYIPGLSLLVSLKVRVLMRKYLLFPLVPWTGGMSPLEFLISLLFVLFVLLSCCINYTLETNPYLKTQYFLTLDMINFRVDLAAFSLMPIMYLMGSRNNPFLYLSGLSHAVMIRFHKVVALIFFVLAIIHSAIWTNWAIHDGGYKSWVENYWVWGVVGSVSAGLSVGLALRFFRELAYELFLILHKSFAVILLVALWYHCKHLGWMGWVYTITSILAFERFCRVVRILMNGLMNEAVMESCSENILRLEIAKPKLFIYYPGSYVYLHMLDPWYLAWQSHPFSLIRVEEDRGSRLVIYLKRKKGITAKIGRKNFRCKVLIDGPYGISKANSSQGDTINIAGGAGIVPIIAKLRSFAYGDHTLIWMVNDLDYIQSFREQLRELNEKKIPICIYCTKGRVDWESKDGSSSESLAWTYGTKSSGAWLKRLIQYQRPDVQALLSEKVSEKQQITIRCCGPANLREIVRKTVCDELNWRDARDIDLVLEYQEW